MSDLVWIADWQIQCCGEEFAVGDRVEWPLVSFERAHRHFTTLLGRGLADELTCSYEGHEEPEVPHAAGVVRRIRTVSCRYAPKPPPADPREHFVVPDSAVIEPVGAIEKWYGTDFPPDGVRFCGWLVDLDLV